MKTHCLHGHAMTPDNSVLAGRTLRCRACLRAACKKFRVAHRRPRPRYAWLEMVRETASGCLEWTGARNHAGYGRWRFRTAVGQGAHRVVYYLEVGPIPAGMSVCHTCDNPPCVNPAHLFVGSAGDNQRDSFRKGRSYAASLARKTHCVNGHEYTPENTQSYAHGRSCRECGRISHIAKRVDRGLVAPVGK